MTDQISEKISETLRQVRTVKDQIMMWEAGTILEGSLFRRDGEATNKILASNLSERLYQVVQKILADVGLADKEKLKDYLIGLKEGLQNMRVVRFEVMFDPDEDLIAQMAAWISRELGENIVINFKLNPSIVGGAIIISEGEYFDFTLSTILERNFERSWAEVSKNYSL